MRACWVVVVVVVLVVCLCAGAVSVQVKVGDSSFPLEAVKQLKELMESEEGSGPGFGSGPSSGSGSGSGLRLARTGRPAACSHPQLPRVFQPVCEGGGAGVILSRLVHVITPVDFCELCSHPSCYGCLQ